MLWPMMRNCVRVYDMSNNKNPTTKPTRLLQPLTVSDQVYQDLIIGFITGLALSNGNSVIDTKLSFPILGDRLSTLMPLKLISCFLVLLSKFTGF